MKKLIINVAVGAARFLNLFFKPLKMKEKVVIISRQSDEPTLDIKLLSERLKETGISTVVLTKTLNKTLSGMISYCVAMISQMYHIATSKVVVLDGYCILVSILPKKKGQIVIQMWHALGAIKKFGWQNVENPDGHGRTVSETMNMHKNYDYILAPSKITGGFFAEGFGSSEEKIFYCGLPKIDFLRAYDAEKEREIQYDYPVIANKESILYVPTFRKNAELDVKQLIDGFDFNRFNLIIKKHFLDKGNYSWAQKEGAIVDEKYSSMEWLRICEKIVTDYSAIAFEAAAIDREIYIYQPDSFNYEHNVGLNVYMEQEAIGKYVCNTEKELFECLRHPYDKDALQMFKNKYLEVDLDDCTGQLSAFISKMLAQ